MYEPQDILIVVGLTLFIVLLINAAILIKFRRGSGTRFDRYKVFGKIIIDARKPWREEDKQLEELSNIIKTINEEDEEDE
jgi:predicted membrane chloride channel (bestrophin family)